MGTMPLCFQVFLRSFACQALTDNTFPSPSLKWTQQKWWKPFEKTPQNQTNQKGCGQTKQHLPENPKKQNKSSFYTDQGAPHHPSHRWIFFRFVFVCFLKGFARFSCLPFDFFGPFWFSRWFSHVSARDWALPDLEVLGFLWLSWYHLGCLDSPRFLWTPRVCAFPRFLGHSHAPYPQVEHNPYSVWSLWRHEKTNLDNKTSMDLLASLVKLLIDIWLVKLIGWFLVVCILVYIYVYIYDHTYLFPKQRRQSR